jgi:hypothetical protein
LIIPETTGIVIDLTASNRASASLVEASLELHSFPESEMTCMTEEENKLMEQHGITCERRTVYFYKGYKYEKLNDALSYANIETVRQRKSVTRHT